MPWHARTCAYARVKLSKFPNRAKNHFAYVSDHFEHFQILRARYSRVFACSKGKNENFCMESLSNFIHNIFTKFQVYLTQYGVVRACQSWNFARAPMAIYSGNLRKKCNFKIRSSSLGWTMTPYFLYIFRQLVSCTYHFIDRWCCQNDLKLSKCRMK